MSDASAAIGPLCAADCLARDRDFTARDDLDAVTRGFAPGADGVLHFDANSIGPMPADAPARMAGLLENGWRVARRRGWNDSDWLDGPQRLGAAIAPLVGAAPADLLVCDSTSVNLYKLLRHGLAAGAPRPVIVVEATVFPTNRYVAEGIARAGLAQLRILAPVDDDDPDAFADGLRAALAPGDVAVVALSHVDYRSGRRLDMASLTAIAHRHGTRILWDLSHSAGAVAIDLAGCAADYAVASGYKYLCGGPGAPALLYQRGSAGADGDDGIWPAICGWMGHADTFAFSTDYTPAPGALRHRVGTPAVVANAAFAAAADLWRRVDPAALDARHRSLGDTLIRLIDERCAAHGLTVSSPRQAGRRGGHVALRFAPPPAATPSSAAAVAPVVALGQALIDAGVVVSVRKPDALRFGLHPLTTRHADLWAAVERLVAILADGRWRDPSVAARAGV